MGAQRALNKIPTVIPPCASSTSNAGGGQSRISYGSESVSVKYDGVITPNFFVQGQISHKKGYFDKALPSMSPT